MPSRDDETHGHGPSDPPAGGVYIDNSLVIPRRELVYQASRSGGPGGQHVNTSSSRVEVLWDVAHSQVLDESLRDRLLARLATRMSTAGVLRVVASDRRSQLRNREAVDERLAELVRRAIRENKPRRPSRPPARAREERLSDKRKRAERKRNRRPDVGE